MLHTCCKYKAQLALSYSVAGVQTICHLSYLCQLHTFHLFQCRNVSNHAAGVKYALALACAQGAGDARPLGCLTLAAARLQRLPSPTAECQGPRAKAKMLARQSSACRTRQAPLSATGVLHMSLLGMRRQCDLQWDIQ